MSLRMTVAAVLKLVELCLKFCQRPDSGIHRLNLPMKELVNMPGLLRLTAVVIQNLTDFLKTHIEFPAVSNKAKPRKMPVTVGAVVILQAHRGLKKPLFLVIADRLNRNPGLTRQFSDSHRVNP